MDKMDGKTMDIVAENVGKMKELFPEAFTEGKVDFEALKEVLGTFVDDRDERYSFTWNGKSKARMIAQTPSTGTLRPCKEESVDWDSTQNIFIEGDNLEVLKLLQKSYHKKVKMIYIDPPYNTGKDFVYKDNFKDNIKNYKEITGQVDGEGRNLSNNPETSGRYHTDWLNMMYPRLKLARNLLKDDGVVFISIDDNELKNLRSICDELFGEENFVSTVVWEKRYIPQNAVKWFSEAHDFLLVYAKNKLNWYPNLLKRSDAINARYLNLDNDSRGVWKPADATAQGGHGIQSQFYVLTAPNGKQHTVPNGRCWVYTEPVFKQMVADNRIWFGADGNNVPAVKRFLSEVKQGTACQTIWKYGDVGHNQEGKKEVNDLFPESSVFETPKPVRLLKRILHLSTEANSIVLDFFAGSATAAHAVMQKNAEDAGNRKFIMVQLPELCDKKSEAFKAGYKTIAEISKERIRRAATKIKAELTTKDTKGTKEEGEEDLFSEADKENFRDVRAFRAFRGSKLDLGFKVFKLDSTNIKQWEVDFDLTERTLEDFISNIKPDRKEEDVLFEILLKYGLDLTLPITEHTIAGKKVFVIGMGALIVCLADSISLDVVEGIAQLKDELKPEITRVVFKDSGFKDDVVKTNAVQILKQAGIVDVRSL